MVTRQLTPACIGSLLGLGLSTVRIHLSCLDKYRVPYSHITLYYYNYAFLTDLRKFYVTKCQSTGKKYHKYYKVVKRIDSLLGLIKTSQ